MLKEIDRKVTVKLCMILFYVRTFHLVVNHNGTCGFKILYAKPAEYQKSKVAVHLEEPQ